MWFHLYWISQLGDQSWKEAKKKCNFVQVLGINLNAKPYFLRGMLLIRQCIIAPFSYISGCVDSASKILFQVSKIPKRYCF